MKKLSLLTCCCLLSAPVFAQYLRVPVLASDIEFLQSPDRLGQFEIQLKNSDHLSHCPNGIRLTMPASHQENNLSIQEKQKLFHDLQQSHPNPIRAKLFVVITEPQRCQAMFRTDAQGSYVNITGTWPPRIDHR